MNPSKGVSKVSIITIYSILILACSGGGGNSSSGSDLNTVNLTDGEDCGNFIGNWSTEETYQNDEYAHGVLSITSDGNYYFGELSYDDDGTVGYDDIGANFDNGNIVILTSGTYESISDHLEVNCNEQGYFECIWAVMCGIHVDTEGDDELDLSHLDGQPIITAFLNNIDDYNCSFDELENCEQNQIKMSKASSSISQAINTAISEYNNN